jgi:hypothetical protein
LQYKLSNSRVLNIGAIKRDLNIYPSSNTTTRLNTKS